MTDEEKFQKTFDKLHASPDVLTEVLKMTTKEQVVPMKKKRFTPKAAAAIAAVVLAAGSGSAAYAMDVGGIQRIVQVWIHGDQTDAIFNVENGNYTLDYKDADGNDVSQGGGGVRVGFTENRTVGTHLAHFNGITVFDTVFWNNQTTGIAEGCIDFLIVYKYFTPLGEVVSIDKHFRSADGIRRLRYRYIVNSHYNVGCRVFVFAIIAVTVSVKNGILQIIQSVQICSVVCVVHLGLMVI